MIIIIKSEMFIYYVQNKIINNNKLLHMASGHEKLGQGFGLWWGGVLAAPLTGGASAISCVKGGAQIIEVLKENPKADTSTKSGDTLTKSEQDLISGFFGGLAEGVTGGLYTYFDK
jgi:hypothetical protein